MLRATLRISTLQITLGYPTGNKTKLFSSFGRTIGRSSFESFLLGEFSEKL